MCILFREQQDEKFGERFQQENHGDETPSGQQSHPSVIRQEETHKGDMHTNVAHIMSVHNNNIYSLIYLFEFTAVTRT